mgnify:CR=1 FL=1
MLKKYTISVILPIYNAERYLKQSIQSILCQTFTDFELLAINDGSIDSSSEILSSFNDKRLRIINNDKNRGLIYTLNRGIEEAKGKYIARMDADDIATPNRLSLQVQFLEQNSSVALVGGCAEFIDENDIPFMSCKVPLSHNEIIQEIFSANCFIHPSVMFRTSVIRSLGGYRSEALHAEDYDLWLRIIEHHQVANLPDNLILYRIHPNQVSQRKLRLQRVAADHSRFSALTRCKEAGRITSEITAEISTFWQKIQGKKPSVGADYCNWIYTYHAMGRKDLAYNLVVPAIISAPLCGKLYKELFRPINDTVFIRGITKQFRWYRSKVELLIKRNKL